MKTTTLEKLIWILIYGGLLGASFGLAVQRTHTGMGYTLIAVGSVAALIGFVLIYVRSRTQD